MARPAKHDVVTALLGRHGRTFAAEAGIDVRRNTPAPLFRLLCLSLLLSARIRAETGVAACRALADAGWTTPPKLAASTWEERTRVLNRAGYARYDESTSRMLATTTDLLLRRYGGDLRALRVEAGRDPDEERRLLQQFSGIGPVGAAIFSREVQAVWDEVYPFADQRALRVAADLGLGADVTALRRCTTDAADLARLVAALVRCGLAGDQADILDRARRR
jgi:endonuclease III